MSTTALHGTGLRKFYDATPAVIDLDLTVAAGEIVALLGPSGCGKTTTLRLIAGFETPDAGTLNIAGVPVAGGGVWVPPERRRVGMVFQNYALFPHLTVGDNVAYGLPRRTGRAAQVQATLELVGLGDLAARMPHELSGGQQQRVALARALAPQPGVLLMDEPFSNLDAGRRVQIREEVRTILKSAGTAVVFVTHDQEEALFMGDRVAVLNTGRLEQVDTPEQVFQSPATRFVAEFLGQTDFLPGRVTAAGVVTEIGVLEQQPALARDTLVDVAFRADDVALYPDDAATAQVEARLFKGAYNVYRVRLPSGRTVHSLQAHTLQLAPGTPVRVVAAPGHSLACFLAEPPGS